MVHQHDSESKRLLFSIHGINTDGPWQEGAAAVLSPFYRYIPIKYSAFRKRAVAKLASDLILFVIFIVVAFGLWLFSIISEPTLWLAYVLFTVICLFVANLNTRRLRAKVIDDVYLTISGLAINAKPPHLIAHSLGTFIAGLVLQKFQILRYHSVILNGCVLRRKFGWDEMTIRFMSVTNEVAGRDFVPYAASLLSVFVSEMGCSGSVGFKNALGVHTVDPETPNPNCHIQNGCPCEAHSSAGFCNRRIHNVRHRKLPHSGYFTGLMHAWYSWLPALWNLDPVLYRSFQDACLQCDPEEPGSTVYSDEDDPFVRLKRTCWGWTKGSLESCTRKQIMKRAQFHANTMAKQGIEVRKINEEEIEDTVDVVITVMWNSVTDAARESKKLEGRDETLMQQLEPRTALKRALDAVSTQVDWF